MSDAPNQAETLRRLQDEQEPWVLHNFGDRPGWMPLLGIIEELGEYTEAVETGFVPDVMDAKVRDALADATVFFCDYCSAEGWSAANMWLAAAPMTVSGVKIPMSLLVAIGRIAHSYLKRAQGIRVGEDHKEQGRQAMVCVIAHLHLLAQNWKPSFDLIAETDKVWQKVKLRDWKKDPENAGESHD